MTSLTSVSFRILGLLGAVCASGPGFAASPTARPNVIVILTDDQGYGDLSCHGNPILKTPNLDRLHAESIRFTDFHVAPVCTPTRGQLMTGVDALRNGAMNTSNAQTILRRRYPTMAEIFAANGYRTAIFGKWHLGENYPYRPQDRGFQHTLWLPGASLTGASSYWNNDCFDDVFRHNGTLRPFKGYCTDVLFSEAIAWIRGRAGSQEPFFCYLPLNAPHTPLFVPDRYREPFRDQTPAVASFFGMIANIDENFGKLEAFLRDAGLRDNTLLVFMTDNGATIGRSIHNAGMRGKKSELYDGGHRVPFFLRWPKGLPRASRDIDLLAEAQDVLPTLIDLCGFEQPAGARFDGVSLAPTLLQPDAAPIDRMLVVQYSRWDERRVQQGDAAVLWKKWRLVAGTELYDVAKDPGQKRNIIGEFPDVAGQMRAHYDRWWAGVGPRVNEASPIHVGSDRESPSVLTPCHWREGSLDQQNGIRRKKQNGAWDLFVEHDGDYEISLRRWPIEANAAITAGMPEFVPTDRGAVTETFRFRAAEPIPIASAHVAIGGASQSKPVARGDLEITFVASLSRGPAELRAWFSDAGKNELCGAYYVYVRRKRGE